MEKEKETAPETLTVLVFWFAVKTIVWLSLDILVRNLYILRILLLTICFNNQEVSGMKRMIAVYKDAVQNIPVTMERVHVSLMKIVRGLDTIFVRRTAWTRTTSLYQTTPTTLPIWDTHQMINVAEEDVCLSALVERDNKGVLITMIAYQVELFRN